MSNFRPAIPQKLKQKTIPIFDRIVDSTIQPNHIPKNTSGLSFILDETIFKRDNGLTWIDQIQEHMHDLKAQDQTLMQLFMCVREEILMLQEIGNKHELLACTPISRNLLPDGATHRSFESNSQFNPNSFVDYFQKLNESSKQDCEKFDIGSHFNFAGICKAINDFREDSTFFNSFGHIASFGSTDEFSKLQKREDIFQLPPVPQKTVKRHVFPKSNLPDSLVRKNNEMYARSLLIDPVLDQGWPRSRSFSSNAFICHTRKSSMTLSDLYDHLNPLGKEDDPKRSEQYPNHFTEIITDNHPFSENTLNKFPLSKSNLDCKLCYLDSSYVINRENSNDVQLGTVKDTSQSSDDFDNNKFRLLRTGSTPTLSSLTLIPRSCDVYPGGNSLGLSISSQHEETQDIPEKIPVQTVKPKSPNKLLSIISHGISSRFIQHYGKSRTESHSKLSKNCRELDPISGVEQFRSSTIAKSYQEDSRQTISILSSQHELPPPIPPKFSKQTVIKPINLQQTWC